MGRAKQFGELDEAIEKLNKTKQFDIGFEKERKRIERGKGREAARREFMVPKSTKDLIKGALSKQGKKEVQKFATFSAKIPRKTAKGIGRGLTRLGSRR